MKNKKRYDSSSVDCMWKTSRLLWPLGNLIHSHYIEELQTLLQHKMYMLCNPVHKPPSLKKLKNALLVVILRHSLQHYCSNGKQEAI